MLFIVLVVGVLSRIRLCIGMVFQTALWTSVNDRQKLMFAMFMSGAAVGRFYYFGWQSMADSPTSPTHVDSN